MGSIDRCWVVISRNRPSVFIWPVRLQAVTYVQSKIPSRRGAAPEHPVGLYAGGRAFTGTTFTGRCPQLPSLLGPRGAAAGGNRTSFQRFRLPVHNRGRASGSAGPLGAGAGGSAGRGGVGRYGHRIPFLHASALLWAGK